MKFVGTAVWLLDVPLLSKVNSNTVTKVNILGYDVLRVDILGADILKSNHIFNRQMSDKDR